MNYNAVNTKIKAMKSYLLSEDDYYKLCNGKSVEKVANKIKTYSQYTKFISQLDAEHLHRGHIENKLSLALMDDFERIYNFVSDHDIRKYLGVYFVRVQIYILKLILCMIYDKRNVEYSLPQLNGLMLKNIHLDLNRLIKSQSVEDFLNNLRGTDFFDLLNDTYSKTHSLFDLEMELDLYYYRKLYALQEKYLSGANKKNIGKINAVKLELINISWLYRMKKFYNFDHDKIFSCMLPIRYKLTSAQLNLLVGAPTLSEFEKVVSSTYYADMFATSKFNVEHAVYSRISKIYKASCLNSNKDNIAYVSYYIYLKEMEINNLTSVIEGVRYGIAPDKIMEYLYL